AQAEVGLVTAEQATIIAEVCADARLPLAEIAHAAAGSANPISPMVQALRRAVGERCTDAAEVLHRGATSQDIMDTASMLITADMLERIAAELALARDTLATLASAHIGTVLPGRTLAQQAVPISFGTKCAGYLQQLDTLAGELDSLRHNGIPAQLGGAAGTMAATVEYARLAGFDDPERRALRVAAGFAARLGLAEPALPWHTARLPVARMGMQLALLGGALGKIAMDVKTLSRNEIAELHEGSPAGWGGSTTMPQKRNPVRATLILAAAEQLYAHSGVLQRAMLAEDERPAGSWQAEWAALRDCLRLAASAAQHSAALLADLEVDVARMRANALAAEGILAERLAIARAQPGAARPPRLLDPADYLGASAEFTDRVLRQHRSSPPQRADAAHNTDDGDHTPGGSRNG
ncbi:MAG: lyase family protein, partial [Sciscionella sp.]